MGKETDALLKIARERENKKDLLAYQKLKEISTGRTYSEVQDILDRMGKQLSCTWNRLFQLTKYTVS